MILLALLVAGLGVMGGQAPPPPAPAALATSERLRQYVQKCDEAGGVTILSFDDERHGFSLTCVTAALRRIHIELDDNKP